MLFATRNKSQGSLARHAEKQQKSFDAIAEKLVAYYDMKGYSASIKRQSVQCLKRLGKHPNDVTKMDLISALARIPKNSSKQTARGLFKSVFKVLFELGLIKHNPALDLPTFKKPRHTPKPLTDPEAYYLTENAPEPFRTMFILGCFAGLRAMEVAGIKGSDLEFHHGSYQLRVYGKGATELTIPAHPKVVDAIQAMNTMDHLFPGMKPDDVSYRTRRFMHKNGVAKSFHCCRHYFATTALKVSGGDIMAVRDLMRHTDVATTQIYLQVAQGRGAEIMGMFHAPTQVAG
jgi:integrase